MRTEIQFACEQEQLVYNKKTFGISKSNPSIFKFIQDAHDHSLPYQTPGEAKWMHYWRRQLVLLWRFRAELNNDMWYNRDSLIVTFVAKIYSRNSWRIYRNAGSNLRCLHGETNENNVSGIESEPCITTAVARSLDNGCTFYWQRKASGMWYISYHIWFHEQLWELFKSHMIYNELIPI